MCVGEGGDTEAEEYRVGGLCPQTRTQRQSTGQEGVKSTKRLQEKLNSL